MKQLTSGHKIQDFLLSFNIVWNYLTEKIFRKRRSHHCGMALPLFILMGV
jgi:hypothetical protein